MTISVIIPCYNEEENIKKKFVAEVLPNIEKLKEGVQLVLVDDGSKDDTLAALVEFAKNHKNTKIIKVNKNRGLGYAVRQGIKAANGELTITLDADLTYHPKEIPKLLEEFAKGKADCVIGSHFMKGGKTTDVPAWRIFLSKAVNLIYLFLFRKRIYAISSIFRLYKTADIQRLQLESEGFDINVEILAKLLQQKKRITEVPVTLSTREFGESKLNTKREVLNHLRLMYKIVRWQR